MWQHCNSALHNTQVGRELILKAEINLLVRQTDATGTQEICKVDQQIFQTPLEQIISGTLALKQQWIDSIAAACIGYQKEQEATKQERKLMETWANYKQWLSNQEVKD